VRLGSRDGDRQEFRVREGRLILRGGILAAAVAGAFAFLFTRISPEPQIGKAIDFESGHNAAQVLPDKAAGLTPETEGPDIFSRTIQADEQPR
jgi:hypothetical protein